MEIFNWPIKPGMKTDFSPRIRSVQFGDGYAQRSADGLNSQLEKYSISLSLRPKAAKEALAFLKRHGGVKSFLFQPIKSHPPVIVVCKKWSSDNGNIRVGISMELEETIF